MRREEQRRGQNSGAMAIEGLKSSNKFVFIWALIKLHIVLLIGCVSGSSVSVKPQLSGCPIKATTSYLTRQAAVINRVFANPYHISAVPSWESVAKEKNNKPKLVSSVQPWNSAPVTPTRSRRTSTVFPHYSDDPPFSSSVASSHKRQKRHFMVISLSHHHVPVEIREKLAHPESVWANASSVLTSAPVIDEAAFLSTCNRFEIYLSTRNPTSAASRVLHYLSNYTANAIAPTYLHQYMSVLLDRDAALHVFNVACGLDSLVVGENQILDQVKRVYNRLPQFSTATPHLSQLLSHAISTGKRVRCHTAISKGGVSISSAATDFTSLTLTNTTLRKSSVAIIGAGKMSKLLLQHLKNHRVKTVTVVNRSPASVEMLRSQFPSLKIVYEPLSSLSHILRTADIVYACTSSNQYVITPQNIPSRRKPLYLIDISVPRNIDPACASNETSSPIHIFNVDHLKSIIAANTNSRKKEIVAAKNIIQQSLDDYFATTASAATAENLKQLSQDVSNKLVQEIGTNYTAAVQKHLTKIPAAVLRLLKTSSGRIMSQVATRV